MVMGRKEKRSLEARGRVKGESGRLGKLGVGKGQKKAAVREEGQSQVVTSTVTVR